jgi:hypothetical protein
LTLTETLIAQSGGLVPALEKLRSMVGGSDKAMLSLVGSTEALNAWLGVTGRQNAAFVSTLDAMRTGANQVDAAFDKQNQTAIATTQRLRNSLEGVSISIGRILVPVLEHLAPMLERTATWWEGLSNESQRSFVILGGAAAALGPTIGMLGNLGLAVGTTGRTIMSIASWSKYLWMMRASLLGALVPSLAAGTASVWAFTIALLANPVTWVIAGIVALAGAAYLIYKNWEPIKVFFVDLWAKITNAFMSAWEKIKPIAEKAMQLMRYTPLGVAIEGGKYLGEKLFAEDARPTLGAERAVPPAGARSSEARVTVDFTNLPRGTRVTPAKDNTAALDLSAGYSMVTP